MSCPQGQGAQTRPHSPHLPFPADSTTVFTGQCFVDEHGKEILKTMWLLRSHVNSIDDDWKATR